MPCVTENLSVRADERANPQHDGKSQLVQAVKRLLEFFEAKSQAE